MVRLYGPAGIGKSGFAYALAHKRGARGAVILDSRDVQHVIPFSEAVAPRCKGMWAPGCGRPYVCGGFARLRGLSFVRVPQSARVHDLVREVVADDLLRHTPAAWQASAGST